MIKINLALPRCLEPAALGRAQYARRKGERCVEASMRLKSGSEAWMETGDWERAAALADWSVAAAEAANRWADIALVEMERLRRTP